MTRRRSTPARPSLDIRQAIVCEKQSEEVVKLICKLIPLSIKKNSRI